MKKIGLLLVMCGLLANCGGGGGAGSAMSPLTEDQKQEVLKVSSSMGDMKSVEQQKTGNPKVDLKSNKTGLHSEVRNAAYGVDLDRNTDGEIETTDSRLSKVQRHLENTAACEPTFEMTPPTGGNPVQIEFSLAMGSEECGIHMTSNFSSVFDINETTGEGSLNLDFDASFKTYGEFQDDFDVTEFAIKGNMKGNGKSVSTPSGGATETFNANGTFSGEGVSKVKGTYQFEIIAMENSKISTSGRDSQGNRTDLELTTNERIEVKYIFTDFTAVLVSSGITNDKGEMVYEYSINGVKVDQEDPEAMKEFESMAGSFGVPGTPSADIGGDASDSSDTGVPTSGDDVVSIGL